MGTRRSITDSERLSEKIWSYFRAEAPEYGVIRIVGENPADWLLQAAQTYEQGLFLRIRLLRRDGQFAFFENFEGERRFCFTDHNLTVARNFSSGVVDFFHARESFEILEKKKFELFLRRFFKADS